ncbi:MAG: hypothetical protein EON93_03450 [Burkholderiales bacterium]|nr:MAG: hypothetical protein EON93_03450 [Burkholderiales bacterium]
MNTRAPEKKDAPAIPAPLRAPALGQLWAEAAAFVGFIFEMFCPDRLRTTGVSRRRGALLSIFLANVEAGIRRLILAAALVFTPPALRPRARSTQTHPTNPSPKKHRAGLCILRLPSMESTPAIPSQLASRRRPPAPTPYGHMPFPCDPLLSLPPRKKPGIGRLFPLPFRNPLDRWVRQSGSRRDRRPPEPSSRPTRPKIARDEDAERIPQKRRAPQANEGLPESLWDWRRCHDAWTNPIPAPDFAARLDALRRAIANPQALITSTARRIALTRAATRAYAATRAPRLRPPKRARDIDRSHYGEDFAPRCHARILDTS